MHKTILCNTNFFKISSYKVVFLMNKGNTCFSAERVALRFSVIRCFLLRKYHGSILPHNSLLINARRFTEDFPFLLYLKLVRIYL